MARGGPVILAAKRGGRRAQKSRGQGGKEFEKRRGDEERGGRQAVEVDVTRGDTAPLGSSRQQRKEATSA